MFQLVQNIWLWALTALAVPVIIHLWNTRPGKTLKVGSISLFTETARSHARSFKLSELLLLVLRCLLLIVLVLILGKAFWIKQDDPAEHKGWFLVEKNGLTAAYKKYKPQIDSLIAAGYQFHYFNPGFEQEAFEVALATKPDTPGKAKAAHWSLLKELDGILPAKIPVYLFTDNALQSFRGNRAAVNLNLKWLTYQAGDSSATWVEKAFETIDDSVCVVMGSSNSTGTWYTNRTLSRQGDSPDLKFIAEERKTFVDYVPDSGRVEVDTMSVKVAIYYNGHQGDASYIKAAIEAVKDITRRKITVNITRNAADISPVQDWLFWFSDEDIPSALARSKVLRYSKGEGAKKFSAILTGDEHVNSAGGSVTSYMQVKDHASDEVAEVIWSNGFGEPLLSRKANAGEFYSFSSRFNPQWNDMPWSSQFPQMMYDLLFGNRKPSTPTANHDKRRLEAQQLFAVKANGEIFTKEKLLNKTDLSALLWLVAFSLFLLERIIVHTSKSRRADG